MNCDNCKHTKICTRVWRNSKKECPHYVQKTNADHIRSMTDEELAAWVAEFVELVLEANGMDDKYKLAKSFETNVLDKLKQPYKEES